MLDTLYRRDEALTMHVDKASETVTGDLPCIFSAVCTTVACCCLLSVESCPVHHCLQRNDVHSASLFDAVHCQFPALCSYDHRRQLRGWG